MKENLSLSKESIRILLGFVVFSLAVKGFFDTALAYDDYRIALGVGIRRISSSELSFFAWYFLYGTIATLGLATALAHVAIVDKLTKQLLFFLNQTKLFVGTIMVIAFLSVLLFRLFVVQEAPIADDEATYVFIAKTLLRGKVVNPVPADSEFFTNQFVIINQYGWFGKYPIGHPLVLAVGIATNTLLFIGPLLAVLTVLFVFRVGRIFFGKTVASFGILMLVFSPHFIGTWATLLSQTTSTVALLAGIYYLIRLRNEKRWYWALATGIAFGFGILARPMPGLLFLLVAIVAFFVPPSNDTWFEYFNLQLKNAFVAAIPILAVGLILLLVNKSQTGEYFKHAYQLSHGTGMGVATSYPWQTSVSVGSALLRQNFWLLGWPLTFIVLCVSRVKRRDALLWGMVAAVYMYRVIAPKTVVSTTGPIYVTEIVPILLLFMVTGFKRLLDWGECFEIVNSQRWISSISLSSTIVALCCFVSVQSTNIHRGGFAWNSTYDELEQRGVSRVLVFADFFVSPNSRKSWAYFPGNPSPDFDDDILVVRIPEGDNKIEKMVRFWQTRFSKREAFISMVDAGGARLIPLTDVASTSSLED